MPTLYISEFTQEAIDAMGREVPVAKAPPVANQAITISGSSAQSATLNASTTLVRLHTDANCSVLFGTNPTATTSSPRLATNQTEYFGVQANSGLKIATILNS